MLKFYHEDPEFDEFTRFDTNTGRLETITAAEFSLQLPSGFVERRAEDSPIQRVVHDDIVVFTGERPTTHVRFPRRIYFQITRNCNLECEYCFIKAEPGAPHVPTESIFDVAEFMGQNGLMEARLTGGEPTIHPDFIDVMHKFKEEGVYVSVATNGIWTRMIKDALCEEPNLWIVCSVDGPKDLHDRYRPRTFDTIIKNLRDLKERNPQSRIRLTTVLTRENMNHIYDLGAICKSVDAESITVIPLRPQVRDPSVINQMVSGYEFRGVIEDLIRASKDFGIKFTTTIETDYKDKMYSDPVFRKRSSCAAGREATNLDYNAATDEFQVYACSYSPGSDLHAHQAIRAPFLAGTFQSDSVEKFLDIWRNETAWRLFRDLSIRSDDCTDCEYLARHKCTGSCPIQNIDLNQIDANKGLVDQLALQIKGTSEWYCYHKLEERK